MRMTVGRGRWILAGVATVALATAITVWAADSVVVVANAKAADSALTAKEVQDIFLGRKTSWSDNSRLVPVTLSGGETHAGFLAAFVEKTESQFVTFWKKQVFSGKGLEPRSFSSEEALLKYVASTDGAVGYISAKTAGNVDLMKGCKIVAKQ